MTDTESRASRLFINATISEERWDAVNQRMIYRVEYDEEVEPDGD